MKKLIVTFFITLSVLSYPLTVYDPANYAVNLDTKLNTLQQIENQVRGLENDARSLVNQAKQLKNFDMSLSMGSIQDLRNNLQKIIRLQNSTKSIVNDYVNLQDKFSSLYPDYMDASYQTPSDYSRQAQKLSTELNNVTYDTMKSLEIVEPEKYKQESEQVAEIMSTAKDAEGQLQAIQATVQLAGMTTQQIQELKVLTAQSLKLQSTYVANQNQKQVMDESKAITDLEASINTSNSNAGMINSDASIRNGFKKY